jgi:hypothetical protein
VAYFNKMLWVIGCDNSGHMMQSTLTLEKDGQTIDLQGGDAKSASNWTRSEVNIPSARLGRPVTRTRCAATPLGDALYLFWSVQSDWQPSEPFVLQASRYTTSGYDGYQWDDALTLQDKGGQTLHPTVGSQNPDLPWTNEYRSTDVFATPFGDDTILVAGANFWWEVSLEQCMYIGTFRVKDIDHVNKTWIAHSANWIPYRFIQPWCPWLAYGDQNYLHDAVLSIDWINSPGGPTGRPPYWLWATVSQDTKGQGTFLLALDAQGGSSWDQPAWLDSNARPYRGFAVRDPAGRVRKYSLDWNNQHTLFIDTFNSSKAPAFSAPGTQPLPNVDGGVMASVAFFTDMNGGRPITVGDQNWPGTQYPVYEFIVYPASNVKCHVNLIGYAQVLPNYLSLKPKPKPGANTFITAGIVDGPIPLPSANIATVNFQDTQPDFGAVCYSRTDTQSTDHTASNSFTVGIHSEAGMTKGFGPAWDIAINGGAGYTNGTVSTTSTVVARTQDSKLDVGPRAPTSPHQRVIPGGTVFGTQAVMQVTAYRFVDPDGNPISDGTNAKAGKNQAPIFVTVQTTFNDSGSQQYYPYAVTPGDLDSYTPPALDTKMKAFGYDGKSYFAEVIAPNAYKFKSGQNYLEVSWSANSSVTTSFDQTDSAFTEQSWTFDASVYIGVSGGGGVSIFGEGEEGEFKFLVGGAYSYKANTTRSTTTGWGIAITNGSSGIIGPPAINDPSAMSRYTFRLYFLPPPAPPKSNYWVQELQTCLRKAPPPPPNLPFAPLNPDDIDVNASPWKIVFVVTSYESNDGKQRYNYTESRRD